MTYVISDIHGCYDQYKKMLTEIEFKPSDTLFVLGDVVDRGPAPVKVLLDMMSRPNVFPIMGNHEGVAINFLSKLLVEITEDNYDKHFKKEDFLGLHFWFEDGGEVTLREFSKLPKEERLWVYEYLLEFSLYEVVTVGEKKFILSHAGLPEDVDLEKLESENNYDDFDFVMAKINYNKQYFGDDVFTVTGHTPTMIINPYYKGKIYRSNNNIAIDTGAVFGARMSCLCLETDEEFYV